MTALASLKRGGDSGDWRRRLNFPFPDDAGYHLDATNVRDAFRPLTRVLPNALRDGAIADSTPKKAYGADRLKRDPEKIRRVQDEYFLFAAVKACFEQWRTLNADPKPDDAFDADDDLVKDGDALLGSLVFSHQSFHERLAPPLVDTANLKKP